MLTKVEAKKRMMKILKDTVAFYSKNPSKRGISPKDKSWDGSSRCMLLTEEGNKCAVGRMLSDGDLKAFKKADLLETDLSDTWGDIGTRKIKELPYVFWKRLQVLHDNDKNWNEVSITGAGVRRVKAITAWIKKGKFKVPESIKEDYNSLGEAHF